MLFRRLAVSLALTAALVLVACGDDDDGGDDDPTATSEPQASATAPLDETATPEPSTEIREVDLAAAEPVQALAQSTGGSFDEAGVLYGDVTSDNVEEAVAPITSGGTAGIIAVSVLTPDGEGVIEILAKQSAVGGGLVANIVGGQLVLTEPAPGPDDPECCPSQLRTTIYAWNGEALVVESETVAPNEQGANKTPTSP
jgi:hypothetical protein